MQLAVGRLDRVARHPERSGQGPRGRQGPSGIEGAVEDQLADRPLDADMPGLGLVGGVTEPGFDRFELGVAEQLAGYPVINWRD